MSSNSINTVPIFAGVNFHTWQQQMGDFLHFQRLWRIISGQATRPVGNTPADLAAQNAWDEGDEQAQGILGLHLSPNLHTHLDATSALSWTTLDNALRQSGVATIYADLQAALHVRISGGQNPQVEMQRLLTLFERLHANGMQISDPIQGMMTLCALPAKWDNVAMVYVQGVNALANVTFATVRDAIMAEYEQTARPSTLAAQKISAVKHKGKSPQFREQTQSNKFVPKASGDAPSGDAPKKKRQGGQKDKGKVHAIVSSALIPQSVTNCMQESHHVAPVMAAPTPAPQAPGIIVDGPSCAPVSVPTTVASFNSSGVSYWKAEPPKTAQTFTGFTGKPSPNTYAKAVAKKSTPPPPVVEKERTQSPTPLLERIQPVASGSNVTLKDISTGPSLEERISSPPVEHRETPLRTTEKKKRVRKPKKAKKEQDAFPEAVSDRQWLYEACKRLITPQPNFENPVAENSAPLFVEPVQNHNNPHNDNKVNPEHPHAPFYQRLIDSFKQGSQQGLYDPYLNDVTDYHESSSEDEREAKAKHKRLNKFLKRKPPTNPSGVRFTEEDTLVHKEGWDDRDNNPDSHVYNGMNNGYHRYSGSKNCPNVCMFFKDVYSMDD